MNSEIHTFFGRDCSDFRGSTVITIFQEYILAPGIIYFGDNFAKKYFVHFEKINDLENQIILVYQ